MSKLILFDFACAEHHVHEDLVDPEIRIIECPQCGKEAHRLITGTHTDPRMGLSNDFPTAARKWEKKQRQRAKQDNIDGPNLWMH